MIELTERAQQSAVEAGNALGEVILGVCLSILTGAVDVPLHRE